MPFDIARIRGHYPALGDGWVHLDGAAGMLVPEPVASAVATAMRAPVSGPGAAFPASQRAESIVAAARRAVADLVGGHPDGVVLGPNAAVLTKRFADVVAENWTLGDEAIVSRLDELSNQRPWQQAMRRIGGALRWGEIDIETCDLPAWQYERLVSARTKVVAITAAAGTIGTRPDLPTVAEFAKRVGAMMFVDATYAAPFVPFDIAACGADVIALSALTWGGPAVGALVFRDPSMLDQLRPVALDSSAVGPERLELGPHPYPMLAGLVASVDFIANLDDAAKGSRRNRLLTSMGSVKAYTSELYDRMLGELRAMPHVTVIGGAIRHIPVLALTVRGRKANEVTAHLAAKGICAFTANGTDGLFGSLGVAEVGGVVRIGLAHYSNDFDVNQLVRALYQLR
ncbi:MAG: cysteine desulfurase-like protein [Actinophytocola sp.]|nr:cysteine desulfurase-like protein [Actinophytocola sp.]